MKTLRFFCFVLAFSSSTLVFSHERWVENSLTQAIDRSIFHFSHPTFQSLFLRSLSFAIAIIGFWILRKHLAKIMEKHLPRLRQVSNFVFKSHGILNLKASKLIEDAALRLPALVLIYSAAGGFLIMPSFPVPSEYLNLARFVQAILAIMIVADFCLPIVGAAIFATIALIFAFYGLAAIDVLPVAGIAYLYLTTKVRDHHFLLKDQQIKVVRIIIGVSFFLLGVMKIVLPEIIVGVADHYKNVMEDPLILPFWLGTDSANHREYWALGFAFSEMLTGALIAAGVFSRTLALIGAFVFGKLMLSSFGWLEFPHIFPIACLLLVALHPSRKQKAIMRIDAREIPYVPSINLKHL